MGVKNIDIELKRQYVMLALKWCKENLGVNRRRKNQLKVSLRIRFKCESHKNFCGVYYPNENKIIIYDLNCDSLEEIISTLIHEYTHYLQSTKKYWEFFQTYFYSTHPYEKEANKNSVIYTDICLKTIKKLI